MLIYILFIYLPTPSNLIIMLFVSRESERLKQIRDDLNIRPDVCARVCKG